MKPNRFDRETKRAWLRLARTPRIGPVTFHQLHARYGSPAKALRALPGLSRTKLPIVPFSEAAAEAELTALEAYGGALLCLDEPDYPPHLAALSHPPPILSSVGHTRLGHGKTVAIVGSRQASAAGRHVARTLAAELSEAGWVCVSGLARGIDGEAHAASLDGGTIAVVAGGLDHIYPPQHANLYTAIAKQGLILSENPLGYVGQARDFPRRNRLITGLAQGVVVIEAAERSGSLISARTAGEQGREVMAVPGSPLDPRAAGSNRLIREGATLVRNAADVIEALSRISGTNFDAPPPPSFVPDKTDRPLSDQQIEQLFDVLSFTPMSLDELSRAAELSVSRCAAILVELELAGRAQTLAGGLALRVPDSDQSDPLD